MGEVAKTLLKRRPLVVASVLVVAVLLSVVAVFPAKGGTPSPITSVGMVDPSQGLWHLRNGDGEVTSFFYGTPGDVPFMGDWDCDGVDTPGLYRQSDGFVYLRNSNTQGPGEIRFFFGNPGDIPLAGDFDGDGCDTVSLYRPSEGRVYIINKLGQNEGGLGAADYWYYFGIPGDKPFVGDFDGDGKDTVGLHRESTGRVYFQNTFWLKYDSKGNQIDGGAPTAADFIYGNPGDRLVAGDWNGDGKDSPLLFRPSDRTLYFRFSNTPGFADDQYPWGDSGWIPVAGNFGPLSSGVRVSISGASAGIKNAVEAYYLWYWGVPEVPSGLFDFLTASNKFTLYPKPRTDSITGWAKTETVGGVQVAVVGAGSDILLLVSEGGDHWRVVGSKLARHGLPAWYGDPPRQLLVLGGDARPGKNPLTSNADSIHIVTVDPATGSGAITGLPRDTFIPVSYGTGIDKLSITMRGRGPQSSLKEIKAVSGIPIEGYIVTAFEDFTNLVDSFDGLGYFGFFAKFPYSVWGNGDPSNPPCVAANTWTLLDGADALCAAIERFTLPSGDVDRQLNHGAEALWALDKAQALGIDDLPRLFKILYENTWTDLSVEDLFTFAAASYQVDPQTFPNIVLEGFTVDSNGIFDAWECQVNNQFLNPRPSDTDCVNVYGGEVIFGFRFYPANNAVFTDLLDGRLDTNCVVSMNPPTVPGDAPAPCWMRPAEWMQPG